VTVRRLVILFLAMGGANTLTHLLFRRIEVPYEVRLGVGVFAMTMTAWLVEEKWIRKNLLLGRTFATWFFGMLFLTVLVGWLSWRVWPA
jgi:hypothetical protein